MHLIEKKLKAFSAFLVPIQNKGKGFMGWLDITEVSAKTSSMFVIILSFLVFTLSQRFKMKVDANANSPCVVLLQEDLSTYYPHWLFFQKVYHTAVELLKHWGKKHKHFYCMYSSNKHLMKNFTWTKYALEIDPLSACSHCICMKA